MSVRPTKTLLGKEAREAVWRGVNAIYEAVRPTLGPQAKKALIYRTFHRGSRIVDDGYFVAEAQEPKDIFIRIAADTFKEACQRTNEKVGDLTTTTIVIGGKLFNDAYNLLTEKTSELAAGTYGKVGVMTLRKNILESAAKVKTEIKRRAKVIESLQDLEKIAVISVEDESLGKTIAQMAYEVGVDGFIDVVEGYKGEIEVEVIKGMRFHAKVANKAFVTNKAKYEMSAEDCPILITNYKLDNINDFSASFKEINAKKTSKLIVIAESFSDNVLRNFAKAIEQGFFLYPVACPSLRTEQFEDLAIYCGAKFIDKNPGKNHRLLRNIRTDDIGFLEKLVVKDSEAKEDAVAVGGAGAKREGNPMEEDSAGFTEEEKKKTKKTSIEERIEILKGQLAETRQDMFKKMLERRIASMASAVGVIKVGDSTQASSLYRKLKIEDAVYACKAALRGGYVKGGGLALKEIAEDILGEKDILKNALIEPYQQIQASNEGGVEITDAIIDPAEAVYYAVEHATSVVANLITVEIVTPETEDPLLEEGNYAVAKVLQSGVELMRKHYGVLKEGEDEMEKDFINSTTKGLTEQEFMDQENG